MSNFFPHLIGAGKSPQIYGSHGFEFDRIRLKGKIKERAKLEFDRVAQGTVGSNDLPKNFFGEWNVSPEVFRTYPQAQNVRPVLGDV